MTKLEDLGIDYKSGLERFNYNEKLYNKYLKAFSSDTSLFDTKKYVVAGNLDLAFKSIHTFKGLCLNLSINSLVDTTSMIVEDLRQQNTDRFFDLYDCLLNKYNIIVKGIGEQL